MAMILDDPSPTPSRQKFSPEFCSFIDVCLQKDADARPTAEQLLSHPFITKYENSQVDLGAFVRGVFDPVQRLKDLADMFAIHYYLLFHGPNEHWQHMKSLYNEGSNFSLSDVRRKLGGEWPPEKLVHVVEKLQCNAHGQGGVAIRVSGSFTLGNQFIIFGDGVQVEDLPNFRDLSIDISSRRMRTFKEHFIVEPGDAIGCYRIASQELYIMSQNN